MGKKRLPAPQARITNTYYRPNNPGPQAPQRLAPVARPELVENQITPALNQLVSAMTNYNLRVARPTEQLVTSQEELVRVGELTLDEVKAELMGQARAAEQAGDIPYGSSPYRQLYAQDYLAERLMRDEYKETLISETSKYSNPLANLNPAEFARDTFASLTEGLGPRAKAKAMELYSNYSSQWLAQVSSQRQSRMVSQGRADLTDAAYHAYNEFGDGKIGYSEMAELIGQASDAYYNREGDAGREYIVAALDTYVKTAIQDADPEDLGKLATLVEMLRTEQSGALAMSERHAGALDQIEDLIDNAGDDASNRSRSAINEATSAARDAMSTTVAQLKAAGTPITREAVEQGIRELLGDLDPTGRQGLDNYLALHFGKDLDDIANDTRSLSASEEDDVYEEFRGLNLAEQKVWLADNNGEIPHEVWGRLNAEHRQGQTVRSLDRSVTADATKTSSALTGARAQDIIANAPNGQEGNADQLGSSWLVGANKAALAATERVSKEGGSQDEQEAAAKAAYEQHSRWWQEVAGDGSDYDIERMNEINQESPYIVFSQEDIQAALDISRSTAASLAKQQMTPVEGRSDIPDVALRTGFAWWPAYIDNIDDSAAARTSIDKNAAKGLPASTGDISRINEMNAGAVADARQRLEVTEANGAKFMRINDSGVGYLVRADGLHRRTATLLGWDDDPDVEATNRALQAHKLAGTSPEEQDAGMTESGLSLANFPESTIPGQWLLVNPDTYLDDFAAIAKINTPQMRQEELMTHESLQDNGIILGYQAYARRVGVNDAMGFNDFLSQTIHGIGRFTLPYQSPDDLAAIDAD